jgi:hypothetical protein
MPQAFESVKETVLLISSIRRYQRMLMVSLRVLMIISMERRHPKIGAGSGTIRISASQRMWFETDLGISRHLSKTILFEISNRRLRQAKAASGQRTNAKEPVQSLQLGKALAE